MADHVTNNPLCNRALYLQRVSLYTLNSCLRSAHTSISDIEIELSVLSLTLHQLQTIVSSKRVFNNALLQPLIEPC